MAKKNNYKNENDFSLLSTKVRTRVKNLIDKRLTSQTVMLFAQEYEAYDIDFREELIEYINFLMEIEREKWMNESAYLYEKQKVGSFGSLKQNDFYKKQEELKKFQEYLSKDRTSATQKAIEDSRREVLVKKPESPEFVNKASNKNVKSIEKNSINRMLLEAKAREEKEAREARLRETKRAEEERKEQLAKQKELEKKKKEAIKKSKEKNASKKLEKKPSKKSKVQVQPIIDRNYEKEQAEKEKLWKELYGKTREETLNERKTENEFKESFVEYDKKPNFNSTNEIQKSFMILGYEFSIDEVTDPKNRYFSFWYNLKKRVKTSNISIWLSIHPNKQKSILNKRLRIETNIGIWDKLKAIFNVKPKVQVVKKEKSKRKEVKKEIKKIEIKKQEKENKIISESN
ncbi:hypothetical protein [Spiroplasma monobiae]|uniref:Uncharacterized protein n=1 Tax=Spiroplasma monobiae MQ-1 TaxID=1336748 RepID=A0A2K9LU03_SPISQ|nr:hypothetical protein [Spiroplasma monobiae]AUM62549.1 hypothetical protein SMONO_v1c03000 [Spiroplasma monobiae MQ-1]